MPTKFKPAGVYSAQWIPTTATGELDRASLAAHIAFEKRAGIQGLLALGSTGEFPRFSLEEKKTVLAAVAELGAPLPVLANITDPRLSVAVELGRFARSLGLPGVALMPPTFYPVSQADMLEYFLRVSEKVDLPVMLYNFPELAGNRIGPETVARFAETGRMLAIKQSGGEFAYHRELIALGREKNFAVMSGADTRLPEVFRLGAAGCIGGLVNVVPELMVEIDRRCRLEGAAEAAPADRHMVEVGRIIDQLAFPLNVSAGIAARGLEPGCEKTPVSAESRRLHAKIVAELAEAFAHWGLLPATVKAG